MAGASGDPGSRPGHFESDREMRCPHCGTRLFTSLAEDLVERHFACPRCGSEMELVPGRCEATLPAVG